MSDTKYIKLRHNVWYFQRRVPKSLESLYPSQTMIEESLGTGDIREARKKRDVILGKIQQQILDLENSNPEKIRFQEYVAQMSEVKAGGNYGSDDYPVYWNDVMDPYTAKKEKDQAYSDAFSAVLKGQKTHHNYRLTLKETLHKFTAKSKTESLHTMSTLTRYEKTVNNFLVFINEKDLALADITRHQAIDFITHYRTTLSGATVNGHISRLKTLWLFAYTNAWITGDNPFDKHQINTRKGRQKKQSFTVEEMHNLIEAFKTESSSTRLLLWLGYFTGARISELISIERETISVEAGIKVFKIKAGKTEAAVRTVPIPPRCYQLFDSVRQASEAKSSKYLFHDIYSYQYAERPAYDATKLFSNLKREYVTTRSDKGSHSFRVMLSTALHQAGVDEMEAAYLIGHSRKGLTLTYDYYSDGYNIKQLAKIQKRGIRQLESNMGTASLKVT